MEGVTLSDLERRARVPFDELRDALTELLGDDLAALWAYGAGVSPEPPARLGDLDTHGVLVRPPAPETAAGMDEARRRIEAEHGVELDSWYILLSDAQGAEPPAHLLDPSLVDQSWALHRSHWLAGRYVLLHGAAPRDVVQRPTWQEVEAALSHELEDLEKGLPGDSSQPFAAYAVLNRCRIAHSLESCDGVQSKLESARWALEALPERWHEAIRAAVRWYSLSDAPGDERALRDGCRSLAAYVRRLFPARE